MRKRIHALEAECARRDAAAKATQTKAAKAAKAKADGEDDPRIAQLQKTINTLTSKINRMRQFYRDQSDKDGSLPLTSYRKIMKCLHPDQPMPTNEQRQEASGLLSQWKQNADKARRS